MGLFSVTYGNEGLSKHDAKVRTAGIKARIKAGQKREKDRKKAELKAAKKGLR